MIMAEELFGLTSIFIKEPTAEMYGWLDDNKIKHMVKENKICIKHVLIPRPGHQNEYKKDGYKFVFENRDDAMRFKLQFGEDKKGRF
jgi:hypothetical protein